MVVKIEVMQIKEICLTDMPRFSGWEVFLS